MLELIFIGVILWGTNSYHFKKNDISIQSPKVEDSKDCLSDKDGYSSKGIPIKTLELSNPLDRIELRWQPTIIIPPKVTNVDP